jgi:glutaredoxin
MIMRLILLALCIILSSAVPAFAEEKVAVVVTSSVTVYSRMTTSSTPVGTLTEGTSVIVEKATESWGDEWCHIRRPGIPYALGYVECEFLDRGIFASVEPHESTKLRPYADVSVILYATSWCGYCKQARHMLEGMGVDLVEYDIEQDQARGAEMRQKGGRGVPFVDVEGIYIPGFAPILIKQAVEDRRRR